MQQIILTFLGSSVLTAVVGYFMGMRLQRAKIEGEYLQNHNHIITKQNEYIMNLEERFDEKCKYMQVEMESYKKQLRLQQAEIDVLKKKLSAKGI